MKGVVLSGGMGIRLRPLTDVLNKHLLPVYDRPMIFFPLQTLAASGVGEVAVVLGGRTPELVRELIGDGRAFGFEQVAFFHQEKPAGTADAIGCCREFLGDEKFLVLLGDNIFLGDVTPHLEHLGKEDSAFTLLARAKNLRELGIARFEGDTLVEIVEKPDVPPSRFAVTGLYSFPADAFRMIENLPEDRRGELNLTELLRMYLAEDRLSWGIFDGVWLDAGSSIRDYNEAVLRVRSFMEGKA